MKRVLMLASVASMIDQFNIPNIELLISMGYQVDVACNFINGNTCSPIVINELKNKLNKMNVQCFQIDFARDIMKLGDNIKAISQVKNILKKHRYEFIHCHSPIGGVAGRLVGLFTRTKVIYTAHGFHFFKGAPKKNWLIYYPIEWVCSWLTDILITINIEDFEFAHTHLHAKKVYYTPGIGIDVKRFGKREEKKSIRSQKREELGILDADILLLSVGELNENKNHIVVIKSLAKLKNKHIHYILCGVGELNEQYVKLIQELGLEDRVHLLGFRNDVSELCTAADIFVFPSYREGLSVALMEAMASGLPVVASKIRGNTDLLENSSKKYLVNPDSVDAITKAIQNLVTHKRQRYKIGDMNYQYIRKFDIEVVQGKMRDIYMTISDTH